MRQDRSQPSKGNKEMYSQGFRPRGARLPGRKAHQSDPSTDRSCKHPSRELSAGIRPTDDNLKSSMSIKICSGSKPSESACIGKRSLGGSLTEKTDPRPLRPKQRRLPTLQEVLDAFESRDEYLEPEPEPGDFWCDPDWEATE